MPFYALRYQFPFITKFSILFIIGICREENETERAFEGEFFKLSQNIIKILQKKKRSISQML